MPGKKILLINPPFVKYGGIEAQAGKIAPLNLAYLAAYVRASIEAVDE